MMIVSTSRDIMNRIVRLKLHDSQCIGAIIIPFSSQPEGSHIGKGAHNSYVSNGTLVTLFSPIVELKVLF